MLENDDVFKLSIYLNIFFFFLCKHFAHPKCWGICINDSKFIEVFILKCLLITCPNKTSKVLTLKLKSDLIQAYQRHWHYRKCLIVSLTQELLITPSHKWQSQTMSKIKTTSKVLLKPTSRINHGRRCARRPLYYGDSPQAPPPRAPARQLPIQFNSKALHEENSSHCNCKITFTI